jgi:agmatine deiminase
LIEINTPPHRLGYSFPPEWQKHRSTWLSWPHNEYTWPGGIESIFDSYLRLIEEISKWETVCINAEDQSMELAALGRFKNRPIDPSRIEFYHHATDDAWCRDHGPCFLVSAQGDKIVVDWDYNAWGGKYPPYDLDHAIPEKVASALGLDLIKPGVVLEGGSVDFNGQGSVLTTSSCLLNPNRNPGMSREMMEKKLQDFFGVEQVLWLAQGIAGDDTDGHIDTITRFVGPNTVVTVVEEDPLDTNYRPLQENLAALKKMKLLNGKPLEILTLPMPGPKYNRQQRLPASYANFYICNGAVIVPIFDDLNDEVAITILGKIFKDRQVVGIDSLEILRGLGSFHCLCMQEPY